MTRKITSLSLQSSVALDSNEEFIKENEERWKFALDSANQGVWDWHVPEKIIYFSPTWKNMLGYQDHEIGNKQSEFESRVHPDDIDRLWSAVNAHFKNKTKEYDCEVRFRCKDGSYKWILDKGRVIQRAPDGQVLRVIGTHTDISQLKKNEEALINIKNQLSNALFYNRSLIEASLVAMLALSMEGKIVDINKAAEKVISSSYKKIIGSDFSNHFKPIEMAQKALSQTLTEGFKSNTPLTLRSGSTTLDVLYNGSTYNDINDTPVGIIVTLTDISDVQKTQKNLENSALALAHSNQELQQFAYIASHDLQEPLRSISNFLMLIERRYNDKLDQDGRDFIQFAIEGAERLQQMINDLLLFSRVETQGAPFTTTNINDVMRMVLFNLKEKIETNDAVITYDKLPTLMGDKPQLITCFQNLISNAIKFCQPGVPPKIHISAKREVNDWLFSVSDNGIGIEPQYKDKLFIMFKRLVGREYAGNGIGLAICKRVIDRHGGKIWVDSVLGQGSTFYFTIPFKEN